MPRSGPMLLIYVLTLFLSALLLFLVQPLIGKLIVPLLGGFPAVWNTCMVFFQAMLLAGYAYAHYSSNWLGERKQAAVHFAVLLLPAVALPLGINMALGADQCPKRRSSGCCSCCWSVWDCRSLPLRPRLRCCNAGSPTPTIPRLAIRISSMRPAISAVCSPCSDTPTLIEAEPHAGRASGTGLVDWLRGPGAAVGRLHAPALLEVARSLIRVSERKGALPATASANIEPRLSERFRRPQPRRPTRDGC